MKKYISCLIAALMLSAMLCACGDNTSGSVATSPVPTTIPAMPSASPTVTTSPEPDLKERIEDDLKGGTQSPDVNVSASPAPTSSAK